jgi:predicted MarR family transcription regulator
MPRSTPTKNRPHILSSAHLASPGAEELSEFEYGLTVAANGFNRWIVHCMKAAGVPDLSALDVLVLHHIHHRGRPKRLADLCLVLDIDDTHVVNYALKKLVQVGLVARKKPSKEVFYETTDKGESACQRYREIRDQCLLAPFEHGRTNGKALSDLASRLRSLSGLYDQAARAASSL